mgnify:CR=1 FL=1
MLHMALTEPHQLLPGVAADMGTSAAQEDACLAYTLFDQVRILWADKSEEGGDIT